MSDDLDSVKAERWRLANANLFDNEAKVPAGQVMTFEWRSDRPFRPTTLIFKGDGLKGALVESIQVGFLEQLKGLWPVFEPMPLIEERFDVLDATDVLRLRVKNMGERDCVWTITPLGVVALGPDEPAETDGGEYD